MVSDNVAVLFFIPTGGGGAEKVSINIANILHRAGVKVHVAFVEGGAKNVCSFLDPEIPNSLISAKSHSKRYVEIFKTINQYRPKKVFASLTALSAVAIICKLFFPKLKIIARQCFMPYDGSRAVNLTIKSLFRFADINIAQTDEMRAMMLNYYRLPSQKVITVHNPLDTNDIDKKVCGIVKPNTNRYHYISVARITPAKDYPTLLKAFRIVLDSQPNATLNIFGHPDNDVILSELKNLAADLRLGSSVTFNGYTSNPYSEIIKSDCFVLSSITEGLPNVMLEAMYLNIPVAATKCIPFIAKTIEEGVNGYTAEVGNPQSLATAMLNASTLSGNVSNNNFNSSVEQQLLKIFK
ncbi:MAG: glycosyltransferase [Muribaculaceae bacterium]|nr:glycosyltransferase [Muribaculaceae bacterium]